MRLARGRARGLPSSAVFISAKDATKSLIRIGFYAFARLQFWRREQLFLMYLGILMIPQEVTVVPLFLIMKCLGWLNTYQALILPSAFTAFGTFLLRQFFLTIPRDFAEAVRIDGATHWHILWKVIVPMAKPAIAVLALFTFIGYWNSFFWPLIVQK